MFSNKNLSIVFSILLFVAFAVSGCASAVKADQLLTTEPDYKISDYVTLVEALKGAGVEVKPVEEIQQPFFDANGMVIKVNDADVQVFEFADEDARKAASDQISPDGSSTGTTMINWVDQPNFWAKGQIIALYVGKDAATIDLLTRMLGNPITSHE